MKSTSVMKAGVSQLVRHLTDWEIAKRFEEGSLIHPINNQYNKWFVSGWGWRSDLPMVYWLNETSVEWTESIQWLWFNLNPGFDPKKFYEFARWDRAYHNEPANGFHPSIKKRNFITGENLDGDPLVQDKVRVNGNTVMRILRVEGEWGLVDTIDGNKPAPPAATVKQCPWLWFHANNVHKVGTGEGTQNISPFNFNLPDPTIMILVSKVPVWVWMPAVQPISECPPNPSINYPVDPYRTYLYT